MIGLLMVFGVLAWVLTQPTLRSLPFYSEVRADPENLRQHVEFLTRTAHPRDSDHPENLDRAAEYIRDWFRSAGARTTYQPFKLEGNIYRNVVASFGPHKGPQWVVGAHYDSFGMFDDDNPGADDNASGTAGLLELARLLGRHDVSTRVDVVAFTTEEPPYFAQPKMGSAVHAASLQEKGVDLRGMICLEMIGYFTEEQPWPNWFFQLLYPDVGDFAMVVGRWEDRLLVRHVKRSLLGASEIPAHSFVAPSVDAVPGIDASDHRSYWNRGYHAVMVSDTATIRNPNYHTKYDTVETLNYEKMAGVVDGVFSAVIDR